LISAAPFKKNCELFLTTVLIKGHEAFHKQGMTVPPAWKAFSVFTWNSFWDAGCFNCRKGGGSEEEKMFPEKEGEA